MDEYLASQVMLCVSNAIDRAMCALCGPQWFADFVKDERSESHPIVSPSHHAIETLDMQALLKSLYFRRGYATIVLTYYGFLKEETPFDNERHHHRSHHFI